MVTTVQKWSGREAKALRLAMRASVRGFAEQLGISPRMISKWEAGGEQVCPRPDSQAMLDTCLERSSREVKTRFVSLASPTASARVITSQTSDEEEDDSSVSIDAQVRHPIDGKLMVLVDTGVFLRGPKNEPVWLPAIYMDVTPVTNADYGRFVAATTHTPPSHWVDGDYPVDLNDHPVVNVTNSDAADYATWAGKSLPTADEWEKAARGTKGILYPWGNQRTAAKCNVRETGIGHATPVNRYHSGISPYGVYDMSGNVWEWCRTETGPGRYVLRGSAFTSSLDMATATATNDASGRMKDDDTGFRCVSSPGDLERMIDDKRNSHMRQE